MTTLQARLITARVCQIKREMTITFCALDVTVRPILVNGLTVPMITQRLFAVPFTFAI